MSSITADLSAKPTSAEVTPKTWWQWLVMFPAIAVPLYTAAPIWMDKATALLKEYNDQTTAQAEEQLALSIKNRTCMLDSMGDPQPVEVGDGTKVSGTVCRSGDVFIQGADNRQNLGLYWVPLDVIEKRIAVSKANAHEATGVSFPEPSAPNIAGITRISDVHGPGGAYAYTARLIQTPSMICKPKVTGRFLTRRMQNPIGCYDQVVDMANGMVVRTYPAPCIC